MTRTLVMVMGATSILNKVSVMCASLGEEVQAAAREPVKYRRGEIFSSMKYILHGRICELNGLAFDSEGRCGECCSREGGSPDR